jgi:hypothetical protein
MNYKNVHDSIIERSKSRQTISGQYYEKHHILPKCLGGTNDRDNLVKLTAREHFLIHRLLCKIHQNDSIQVRSKLASAFNKMCSKNHHQRFFNSKQFEIARIEFAKNHPTKCPEVRQKIREAMLSKPRPPKDPLPLCCCGCGNPVKQKQSKYLFGHNYAPKVQKPKITKEEKYKNVSNTLKTFIQTLTPEQKIQRCLNSLHNKNVDHKKRGANISKGKKTNQPQILTERLGKMSEKEFEAYLLTINPKARSRMITYRNRYSYDRTTN